MKAEQTMKETKKNKAAMKKATKKVSGPKPIKREYPVEGKMYRGVLGSIIGDVAGSSREGYKSNTYRTDFKMFVSNSTFTDDTVLTVALMDWLCHKDTLPLKDALLKWGRKFPNASYGRRFSAIIKSGDFGEAIATTNGGAMRVNPVAVSAKSLKEAIALAKESAAPSHIGEGSKGAQAVAAAAYIAKEGIAKGKSVAEIKAEIKSTIEKEFGYNLDTTVEECREVTRRNAAQVTSRTQRTEFYHRMCEADLTCPEAIIAVLNANSYEETVRIAISMGGDSDTLGAMAGGIASQLFGTPEAMVKACLLYLPAEMIDVINEFEGSKREPTGVTPPRIDRWSEDEYVVYGDAPEGQEGEAGKAETFPSRYNSNPRKGYPILTVGQGLEDIRKSVKAFIAEAKKHPERRYHVRKVGYNKAGYTVGQIAPLFADAVALRNVLLPKEMLDELKRR